jgi:hypothetical protein
MPQLPLWRRATVAAAVALPMLLAPAAAQLPPEDDRSTITTTATDANDTAGPLDVRRVRHRVVGDDRWARLTFTVRAQRPFDDTDLSWRQRHFILELDVDGEPGAERNITIFGHEGDLRADLISNATRTVIAHLPVTRIDDRTLRVFGPRRLVGVRKVFWTSNFHRTGAPACGWSDGHPITCQDSVPDHGWLRLDRLAWPTPSDARGATD